jgi:rare lipoprotein A
MGSYVACGSSASRSISSNNYRSQGRVYADRAERRVSGRATKPRLTAERTKARKPVQVATAATAGTRADASVAKQEPKKLVQEVKGRGKTHSGMASYYWQGQRVASGGRFNPNAMTAAHRTLPFGTKVRVTNKRNGKSVVVTINDRGPFIRGRIIDLSKGAAGVIGMHKSGVAPVSVEVLGRS